MKKYLPLLKTISLFDGISENNLENILGCLNSKINHYEKGSAVFLEGDSPKNVGIVLSGQIQIVKEDYYGNRTIVAEIDEGNIFGEAFACADVKELTVSAFTTCESEIMLIDYRKIITTCASSCSYHNKMIFNMLRIIATRNIQLNKKIEFVSKRTTREKVFAYLLSEAKRAGSNDFTIPFNRQELADFLCVDRSAMSNELCKLRDENLLSFNKSHFILKSDFHD